MILDAALIAVVSSLTFVGVVLVPDRRQGALIAQLGTAVSAALLFAALVFEDEFPQTELLSTIGTALLAATVAGMFYHLYLGRFDSIWRARSVFTLVFLGFAGFLGLLYLSFI